MRATAGAVFLVAGLIAVNGGTLIGTYMDRDRGSIRVLLAAAMAFALSLAAAALGLATWHGAGSSG